MKLSETTAIELEILNPKNESDLLAGRDSKVFPYYAGYASSFAEQVLKDASLPAGSTVLDPWNGSGTTLLAAARHGLNAIGFDLNPVMVLAAKAALLSLHTSEIKNLAKEVLRSSALLDVNALTDDPLCEWLVPSSVAYIRKIDVAINRSCFPKSKYTKLLNSAALDAISAVHSFLYVCLFRTVRTMLSDFIPSNPTWVKRPEKSNNRKRPSKENIEKIFLEQINRLSNSLPTLGVDINNIANVCAQLGDAKSLKLLDSSIDFILTSPPYCTRIDYAVATSIELAVIRCSKLEFEEIRRSLVGNSMIAKVVPSLQNNWGSTCKEFLNSLYGHSSQASRSYYYKTHLQYFESLQDSIVESSRVLKSNGTAVFVVQDSYYKEIRNDVAQITVEMCEFNGLDLVRRSDFAKMNSMSVINTRARKYLPKRQTTETVLVFKKSAQ